MDRTPVSSSSIAAIGYSRDERLLEVEFKHGAVYQYRGVPPDVFDAFLAAQSKGTFFNRVVKDHYLYTRTDR